MAAAANANQFKFSCWLVSMSAAGRKDSMNPNSKAGLLDRDRVFALTFAQRSSSRTGATLTRSNAVVAPRTPDQHLDLPEMLKKMNPAAPPPSPSSISRTTSPSLRNVASLSISSTQSANANDHLTVNFNRRRHSDSYFPTKRHNRRHRLRGRLHHKFSFSPNPRLVHLAPFQ